MDKKQRHAAILSIIIENEVETQQELQILLKQAGFRVTQATVSRDIREGRDEVVDELLNILQKLMR